MRRAVTTFVLVFAAGALFAARSAAPPSVATADPRSEALNFYSSGERRLDKVGKIAEELKTTSDEKQRASLQEKMRKGLEGAAAEFQRAISKDPNLFQAHSELGFALRKLGKFDESLAAYDRALTIQPNYSPAIEYRAEAYLGLNRIDDAKDAYMLLFSGDRARADLLFEAMKTYAAAHPEEEFSKWVEQRKSIHATSSNMTASSDLRTW